MRLPVLLFTYHICYKCIQWLLICHSSFKDAGCSWSMPIFAAPTVSFLERIGSFFVWWILWKSMVDSELSSWCTRTKSASLENTPRRLEVQETLLWLLCRGTVLWSSVASGLFGKMAVGILAWTPATSFVIEVFVVFLSPCRQCQNIALNWATPHLLPVLSNLLFTDALIMAVLRTAWDFDGVAK